MNLFEFFDKATAVTYAIVIHVVLIGLLLLSIDWDEEPHVAEQPAVEIIDAVAVDQSQVEDEIARLKAADAARRKAEQDRQNKLKHEAAEARKKRKLEEQRLMKLKQLEKQRLEEQKRQQIAEDKRRAEEARKRKLIEKQKLAELQEKQQREKKRLQELQLQQQRAAEARQREEAKLAAAAEQKRRELEAAERAEQQRLAIEKERLRVEREKRRAEEELQRKRAERDLQEQLAEEASLLARQRQSQAQRTIDRYVATIKARIQNRWLRSNSASDLSCDLFVRILPGGEVAEARVVRSSGDAAFDRSAVTAVFKASPLPMPSEAALFERMREIQFLFEPRSR